MSLIQINLGLGEESNLIFLYQLSLFYGPANCVLVLRLVLAVAHWSCSSLVYCVDYLLVDVSPQRFCDD